MEFHLRLQATKKVFYSPFPSTPCTALPPWPISWATESTAGRVASRRGRLNQLKLGAKKHKIRFVNGNESGQKERERDKESVEREKSGERREEIEMEQRGERAHGRRMLCEVRKMNWSSGKNWQCEQSMRGSEEG